MIWDEQEQLQNESLGEPTKATPDTAEPRGVRRVKTGVHKRGQGEGSLPSQGIRSQKADKQRGAYPGGGGVNRSGGGRGGGGKKGNRGNMGSAKGGSGNCVGGSEGYGSRHKGCVKKSRANMAKVGG